MSNDGVSVRMQFLAGLVSLVMVMLMLTAPVGAAGGLITKPSPYPVAETMDRLERAVKDRELVVIAPHGVNDRAEVVRAMTGATEALTDAVTKAAR